jgi:hypothetical protein
MPWDTKRLRYFLGVTLEVSLILLLTYPGHTHRVLMLLLAVGCTTGLLYGLLTLVIAITWYAPGLILAPIVILLGIHIVRTTFVGAGIGFFALFLAAFFYGIEVTLLIKSQLLIAGGAALLLTCWLLLRTLIADDTLESDYV